MEIFFFKFQNHVEVMQNTIEIDILAQYSDANKSGHLYVQGW